MPTGQATLTPPAKILGASNTVLAARAKRHFVKDFPGPLSIKHVVRGRVAWRIGGRDVWVDDSSFLVLNDSEPYSMADLTAQHEGFTFFSAGGVTLALSTGLTKAVGQAPGAVEVVFSVEHVREAHEVLQRRGVAFLNQPRPVAGPMWAADFHDPDGHILSVFGPE